MQSYVTIFSYISIHGTSLCSLRKTYFSRSYAGCLSPTAIVAWRLYAILRGKAWVAWTLWIAGFLNFAISAGITTASLIPTIGASANHIPAFAPTSDVRAADLRPFHHACVVSVSTPSATVVCGSSWADDPVIPRHRDTYGPSGFLGLSLMPVL